MAKGRCTTRNQKNRCQRQRLRCPDLSNFIAIDLEWSATKAPKSVKFAREHPPPGPYLSITTGLSWIALAAPRGAVLMHK